MTIENIERVYLSPVTRILERENRMTREEAIDILKCGRPFDDNPKADLDEFNLALGVAIKALKNENALIDRVLEIIDNEIKDIDAWEEGREIALPQMNGMLAQARVFREEVLALKGDDKE